MNTRRGGTYYDPIPEYVADRLSEPFFDNLNQNRMLGMSWRSPLPKSVISPSLEQQRADWPTKATAWRKELDNLDNLLTATRKISARYEPLSELRTVRGISANIYSAASSIAPEVHGHVPAFGPFSDRDARTAVASTIRATLEYLNRVDRIVIAHLGEQETAAEKEDEISGPSTAHPSR